MILKMMIVLSKWFSFALSISPHKKFPVFIILNVCYMKLNYDILLNFSSLITASVLYGNQKPLVEHDYLCAEIHR